MPASSSRPGARLGRPALQVAAAGWRLLCFRLPLQVLNTQNASAMNVFRCRLASTLMNSSHLEGDGLEPPPDCISGEAAPIAADQDDGSAALSTAEAKLRARLDRFASGKETGGSAAPTEIQRQAARLERSLVLVSWRSDWVPLR